MTKKIGPKEAQLREMRGCKIDHNAYGAIPKALCQICSPPAKAKASKTVETEKPKARDFRIPKGHTEEEGKALLARLAGEKKAKTEARIAALAEKKKAKDTARLDEINAKRAEKNLAPLRSLTAKAKDQPFEPKEATMKSKTTKKAEAKKAAKEKARTKVKASTTPKSGKRNTYDWNGAREAAAKGTIPKAPDFSANTHKSYRPMLADVEKLVKARNLKALEAYKVKGTCSSPTAVKKYREIALIALRA
jgi:hypothetical protein